MRILKVTKEIQKNIIFECVNNNVTDIEIDVNDFKKIEIEIILYTIAYGLTTKPKIYLNNITSSFDFRSLVQNISSENRIEIFINKPLPPMPTLTMPKTNFGLFPACTSSSWPDYFIDSSNKRAKIFDESEIFASLDIPLQQNKVADCIDLVFEMIDMPVFLERDFWSNENLLKEEANKHGFACHNVPGDGNCFFHAILDQLKKIDLTEEGMDVKKMREKAALYMNGHPELLEFVANETKVEYLKRMSQSGQWADHILIAATANILNLCIVVLQSDKSQPIIINDNSDVRGVLWLGYDVGLHYQSLHRDEQLSASTIKLKAGNVPGNYLIREQAQKSAESEENVAGLSP